VRPVSKGVWRFAGFSRFDGVLAGGLTKGSAYAEVRDIKTEAGMLQWLAWALGENVQEPEGEVRYRAVAVADADGVINASDLGLGGVNRIIAGGSDADVSRGSDVRTTDGPPKPPALGSAPAQPWRSSISRCGAGGLEGPPKPPLAARSAPGLDGPPAPRRRECAALLLSHAASRAAAACRPVTRHRRRR